MSVVGRPVRDESGNKYGEYTVLERDYDRTGKGSYWICKCSCGTIKSVRLSHIKDGSTKSCGCVRKNQLKTHGLRDSALHVVWSGIKNRCKNLSQNTSRNYLKNNIKMCCEWSSDFTVFHNWAISNGWEKGKHIHRLNNFDGYNPNNCVVMDAREHSRLHQPKGSQIGRKANNADNSRGHVQ